MFCTQAKGRLDALRHNMGTETVRKTKAPETRAMAAAKIERHWTDYLLIERCKKVSLGWTGVAG